MTVGELFEADKITKDFLNLMADESSYWQGAASFVLEKWDTDADRLSPKQGKWLTSILEDCVEKRIEGKIS